MDYEHIIHPIAPVYDASSRILILGSLPSVKSREQMFFYGHPQNRFWRVTAAVFDEPVPVTVPEKKAFLLRNHIAVWDTIYECDIKGSSDVSIKNVIPTDLRIILNSTNVEHIFCNGSASYRYYCRYQEEQTHIPAVPLPSTSPANAAWNVNRLVDAWKVIRF